MGPTCPICSSDAIELEPQGARQVEDGAHARCSACGAGLRVVVSLVERCTCDPLYAYLGRLDPEAHCAVHGDRVELARRSVPME